MSEIVKCPCCGIEMRKTILGDVHAWYTCHDDSCAFTCRAEHMPRIVAAMELAKAVKKERSMFALIASCRDNPNVDVNPSTAVAELAAARSEVDRLIANESAADCKGEG